MAALREEAGERLRRARRAVRDERRWRRFRRELEPELARAPRVHRFAAPPMLGDAALAPQPVALSEGAPAGPGGAPWLLLVAPGDRPAPGALARLGQAATLAPDADVLTADHDPPRRGPVLGAPRLHPGPAPDLMLAGGVADAVVCVRRAALPARLPEGPGWRRELVLRLAGPDGRRHAHVPQVLGRRGEEPAPGTAAEVARRVLGDWCPGARVEARGRFARVRRPLSAEPAVEVVVPFRDRPELLRRSVGSLLATTAWERLGVALVDNGSREPETARAVAALARDARVRVLPAPGPFNFSALNNAAAASSRADVLAFLNNDTEVVQADWLVMLLEEALRPEVGAVAPLLVHGDGSVQHAGVALGLHGWAGHPFAGLAPDRRTAFGAAADATRNWLAVTAACMVLERAKLERVGGFDPALRVGGGDVDLCLRLTAAGQRSLCVPHAVVVHDEGASRGSAVDPGDFAASARAYGALRTVGDPFYHPYLSLARADCSPRRPGEPPVRNVDGR